MSLFANPNWSQIAAYFSEYEENIGNRQPDISQIPMPVFSTAGAVFGPQACSLEFRYTPRD